MRLIDCNHTTFLIIANFIEQEYLTDACVCNGFLMLVFKNLNRSEFRQNCHSEKDLIINLYVFGTKSCHMTSFIFSNHFWSQLTMSQFLSVETIYQSDTILISLFMSLHVVTLRQYNARWHVLQYIKRNVDYFTKEALHFETSGN